MNKKSAYIQIIVCILLLISFMYSAFFSNAARAKRLLALIEQSSIIIIVDDKGKQVSAIHDIESSINVLNTEEKKRLMNTVYSAQFRDGDDFIMETNVYKMDNEWVFKWRGLTFKF